MIQDLQFRVLPVEHSQMTPSEINSDCFVIAHTLDGTGKLVCDIDMLDGEKGKLHKVNSGLAESRTTSHPSPLPLSAAPLPVAIAHKGEVSCVWCCRRL